MLEDDEFFCPDCECWVYSDDYCCGDFNYCPNYEDIVDYDDD